MEMSPKSLKWLALLLSCRRSQRQARSVQRSYQTGYGVSGPRHPQNQLEDDQIQRGALTTTSTKTRKMKVWMRQVVAPGLQMTTLRPNVSLTKSLGHLARSPRLGEANTLQDVLISRAAGRTVTSALEAVALPNPPKSPSQVCVGVIVSSRLSEALLYKTIGT